MTQSQEWKTRTLKLEKELAGIREDKSELVGIRYLNYVERYRNSSYFANEMLKKYLTRVKIMVFFCNFSVWGMDLLFEKFPEPIYKNGAFFC